MLHPDLLRVVLVCTRNPLNIGAAARAMANFGFSYLRVARPYEAAFREARSAVGASEILASAEEFDSVANAVADCQLVVGTTAGKNREPQHRLVDLERAAEEIRSQNGRIALLFGSEKRGLSNEDFSYCHWLLRIPTSDQQSSMNLGQAVAVCLYELARRANTVSVPRKADFAAAGDLDRLATVLTEALQASDYIKGETLSSTEEKVRRLVRRLNLSSEDGQLLLGMLRKIHARLG